MGNHQEKLFDMKTRAIRHVKLFLKNNIKDLLTGEKEFNFKSDNITTKFIYS